MATVGTLTAYVNADISNYQHNMEKTKIIAKDVANVVTIVGGAVSAGLIALGTKAVGLAADLEQAKISFKTMLGSASESEKMLKSLYNFAAKTPFEFPEIRTAAKSLLAFGESSKTIPDTLRRIGDISSGISAPLNDIAQIYGKIRVQGRLFAEDMNQLTGRGIPVIQEIARQFNVTESEVRKLVETGKVGFPQIEQAFISLTSEGGKFYNMMEAQSQSMAGLWSTFKDNVNMALTELGQDLIETFDLKDLLKDSIK